MEKQKILILGNKPYSNFKLNNIIDSFDILIRCNLAWPGKNNGTKFGKLAMCHHVYDNFVRNNLSKELIIQKYKHDYDITYLSNWYDYFQINKENFDEIYHQNEFDTTYLWNTMLKEYGCPYKFSKMPTTGYSTIFRNLRNNNKIYVLGFSLFDSKIRKSMGVRDEVSKEEAKETTGYHSNLDEMNILAWLHKNKKIDASLCMLDDTEEISIKTNNNIEISKFIFELINKK